MCILIKRILLNCTKALMNSHYEDKARSFHYDDVIMGTMASQMTSPTIVYSTVFSRHRSKKTSKLRVTGLCVGNSPGTGDFPAQMASYAKNVSIWWRHHGWTASMKAKQVFHSVLRFRDSMRLYDKHITARIRSKIPVAIHDFEITYQHEFMQGEFFFTTGWITYTLCGWIAPLICMGRIHQNHDDS